jgi:hypothetical protein
MKFQDRMNGKQIRENEWQYKLAKEFNGGFGGTNGGVLAAICVNAARGIAPGRQPIGLDARFIRGFRPGIAKVVTRVLNEGRTLTTVSVDIINEAGKLTTRSTVSMVNPTALAEVQDDDEAPATGELKAFADAKVWQEPPEQEIPLIRTFGPRILGRTTRGTATAIHTIWNAINEIEEASCIAADISVGPPVAAALKGKPLAMPNPDISLRFTCAKGDPAWLVSTCRLEALNNGVATTRLEVRDGTTLLAVGISTTTCLQS